MKKSRCILLVILLSAGPLGGCSQNAVPNSPTPPSQPVPNTNGLSYGSQRYPVDKGLLELDGETGYHYHVDLTLTDGEFVPITYYIYVGDIPIPITYWIAADATAEVYAELYSSGTAAFHGGTFDYAPPVGEGPGEPSRAGQNFFNEAYVGIDTNGDNEVKENEEIAVTGGTITVAGTGPTFQVSVDLQLANGLSAKGTYAGEFLVIDE